MSTLVVGVLGAAALAVTSQSSGTTSSVLALQPGAAWFADHRDGDAVLVDGLSATVVERVDVGTPATDLEVVQDGHGAIVLDRTAGTVSRIDGSRFERSDAVRYGAPGDPTAEVVVAGATAWIVTERRTIVQQLGRTLATAAEPSTGTAGVVGDAVGAADGTLHALIPSSGLVESFAGGHSVRRLPIDPHADLVAVGESAVAVIGSDTPGATKVVRLDRGGEVDQSCLSTPADAVFGGSLDDRGWLISVAPSSRQLRVLDIDDETCLAAVDLGVDGSRPSPGYGEPVVHDDLVFVPEPATGVVIVADPLPGGRGVVAKLAVGAPGGALALSIRSALVWYHDEATGTVGVISEDLVASAVHLADGEAVTPAEAEHPAAQALGCTVSPAVATPGREVTLRAPADDRVQGDSWRWSAPHATFTATDGAETTATWSSAGSYVISVRAEASPPETPSATCVVQIVEDGSSLPTEVEDPATDPGDPATDPGDPASPPEETDSADEDASSGADDVTDVPDPAPEDTDAEDEDGSSGADGATDQSTGDEHVGGQDDGGGETGGDDDGSSDEGSSDDGSTGDALPVVLPTCSPGSDPVGPIPCVDVAPDAPVAGDTVTFVVQLGHDPAGAPRWTFDDGITVDGPTASHVWPEPGEHDVSLTAEADEVSYEWADRLTVAPVEFGEIQTCADGADSIGPVPCVQVRPTQPIAGHDVELSLHLGRPFNGVPQWTLPQSEHVSTSPDGVVVRWAEATTVTVEMTIAVAGVGPRRWQHSLTIGNPPIPDCPLFGPIGVEQMPCVARTQQEPYEAETVTFTVHVADPSQPIAWSLPFGVPSTSDRASVDVRWDRSTTSPVSVTVGEGAAARTWTSGVRIVPPPSGVALSTAGTQFAHISDIVTPAWRSFGDPCAFTVHGVVEAECGIAGSADVPVGWWVGRGAGSVWTFLFWLDNGVVWRPRLVLQMPDTAAAPATVSVVAADIDSDGAAEMVVGSRTQGATTRHLDIVDAPAGWPEIVAHAELPATTTVDVGAGAVSLCTEGVPHSIHASRGVWYADPPIPRVFVCYRDSGNL